MSWGGSVLGMINSLKANARKRPSLSRGFARFHERERDNTPNLNYRKIKALSDAERAALRKRVAFEKKLRTKKSILALFISFIILGGIIWVVLAVGNDFIELYKNLKRQ